jgi:hypothetical protein
MVSHEVGCTAPQIARHRADAGWKGYFNRRFAEMLSKTIMVGMSAAAK